MPVSTGNLVTYHSLLLIARIGSETLQLLEKNTRLKKLVAEQALGIDLLKEVNRRTPEPDPEKKSSGAPTAEV